MDYPEPFSPGRLPARRSGALPRRWSCSADGERIAGFIYLGSCDQALTERPRPDLECGLCFWQAPASPP